MKQPIPIKYRGRLWNTGESIFGEAITGDGKYIVHFPKDAHDYLTTYQLQPNSAALMLGYDKDGREVYEGDTLADADGSELTANIVVSFIDHYQLKEDNQ